MYQRKQFKVKVLHHKVQTFSMHIDAWFSKMMTNH